MPDRPIRKGLHRHEVPGGSRFITCSCYRRLSLLAHARIRLVFADALADVRTRHGLSLYAWVVMPEHVHLLVRPAEGTPLDRSLVSLKLAVAQRVLARWKELHAPILSRITTPQGRLRFWQPGGGFDRNVRDIDEFSRHVRYIHRNPVERGLVARPQDWDATSVRWWMGGREGEVPCDPPPGRGWDGWTGYM